VEIAQQASLVYPAGFFKVKHQDQINEN